MLSSETFAKLSKLDKQIGYAHRGHFGKEDTGFDTLHEISNDHSVDVVENDTILVKMEITKDPDSSNWHFQLKH
jgi:hypothetical protein